MVIEVKRKLTEAEAREVTNIFLNIRQLQKKPTKKLSDLFAFCWKAAIFLVASLLFFGFFILKGDRDAYTLAGLVITIAAIVFLAFFRHIINKTYHSLLDREEGQVNITFDENGIDYEAVGNSRLQSTWKNIAFVRVFKEMVCFMPKEYTGILFSVSKEHWAQIKEFLRENDIKIQIVE